MSGEEQDNTWEGLERRKLGATRVQLDENVERTSDEIMQRYRENRDWRLYPKEWIYRNLPVTGEVLDFGCGTGQITTQLALLGAKRVYAMDVTPGLLEVTRERARLDGVADRVELICDYLQNVEPRQVDLVIACAVLHHCHPLKDLMPGLLKWLKPGGIFVCIEPIVYFSQLESLRVASGVPFEPLDEGERKLDAEDIRYVCSCLDEPQRIHYRVLGRTDRWLPDRPLRVVDNLLLKVPGVWKLASSVLIHGKRKS